MPEQGKSDGADDFYLTLKRKLIGGIQINTE